MDNNDQEKKPDDETSFSREVGAQAARKLKAQQGSTRSVWFGLGMSGLIGWSVAVPTLIGTAIGIWVDRRHPSRYSWTLMLLLMGAVVGSLTAWRWVDSQYKEMREDPHE